MLKAINAMLEGAVPDKVKCAQSVVSELIIHLEDKKAKTGYLPEDDDPRQYDPGVDASLDDEATEAQKEIMD